MFGGLNRLLVVAGVAGVAAAAVLAGPSAALAGCKDNTSAVNVYSPCLPSAGGGSGNGSHGGNGKGGSGSGTISGPAAKAVTKAVKHAGKDSRALALVESTGPTHLLRSNPSSIATEPSTVGSALDLSSGPATFLIALAGGALLLLGGSGLRIWRHRRL